MSEEPELEVYSQGLCYASVCAPKAMTHQEVAEQIQRDMPAGTTLGWTPSKDTHFHSGEEVGCPCSHAHQRDTHRHWLLEC